MAGPDGGGEAAIAVDGLTHRFGRGDTAIRVLSDIRLTVARGEVVFLMGPSGCGKTTLLTLVGALRSVATGSVRLLGEELAGAPPNRLVRIRRRIGFVFQHHNLHRSLTVLGNVRMGLEARGWRGRAEIDRQCLAVLDAVGLAEHAGKRQDRISGGQRQRASIARALVGEPAIVLADEPTAALDRRTGHEVVSLMRRIATDRGATVLMVTHDSRVVDLADRIVEMEDGRIVRDTPGPFPSPDP